MNVTNKCFQAPRLSRPQPQQAQPSYEQAERRPQYQAAPVQQQQQPRFVQQERREPQQNQQQPEQYFDYQDVQAAPVRTKYTETPVPQRQQPQPQFANSLDIVYAPNSRPQSQPQQFPRSQFANQQPIQFPAQPEPLFAPAPVKKVSENSKRRSSYAYKLLSRRKRKNFTIFVIKKMHRFYRY